MTHEQREQMKADLERHEAAGRPPHAVTHFDWSRDDWLAGVVAVAAALANNPAAWIRQFPGIGADGHPTVWTAAVDREGQVIVAFNIAHPCPPFCT